MSAASCSSVAATAAGNPNFSILSSLVVAAELTEALADPAAEFTLFAPDNRAFEELAPGADVVALLSENRDMLDAVRPLIVCISMIGTMHCVCVFLLLETARACAKEGSPCKLADALPLTPARRNAADTTHCTLQVLAGHVVPAALRVADLYDGQVLPTLADEPLTVFVDDATGIVTIAAATGGSVAALAPFGDFEACSAVVHVIDTVLIPGDEPAEAPADVAPLSADEPAGAPLLPPCRA